MIYLKINLRVEFSKVSIKIFGDFGVKKIEFIFIQKNYKDKF